MPIRYSVSARTARPFTRWGFTLPPPRPAGPLPPVYLPGGGNGLTEAMMGDIIVGHRDGRQHMEFDLEVNGGYRFDKPLSQTAKGVWTGGISDCMVVCAAYYDPNDRVWDSFWFSHIKGGLYDDIVASIGADLQFNNYAPNPSTRYAVIASGNQSGMPQITAQLSAAGIPMNNITHYDCQLDNRGFAFGVSFSTGLFGEVTGQGAELPANWRR